jgi:hypothetical protein
MKRLFFILISIALIWSIHFGQTMSAPVNVSNSPFNTSRWGQCAFGPDGMLHIVWDEDYHDAGGSDIFYVSYDGKNFSEPVNLKNSRNVDCGRPEICTNIEGGVFVVWDEHSGCYFVEYDPEDDKWSSPFQVSTQGWGGDESYVAADSYGNVYIAWFKETGGAKSYSRSRINGEWESIFRLSSGSRRSTQVGIAAGKDDRVWAIWREKMSPHEYKIYYRKRTKDTEWSAATKINWGGASQTHPWITVGPDNVPVVSYADIDRGTAAAESFLCVIDEDQNPREKVVNLSLHHFSRVVIDGKLNKHVAWQIGPGFRGRGIRYRNNIGGQWNAVEIMPNSGAGPKCPGIAADNGGNVAVTWASSIPGRDQEVWLSTLYPVIPLYPPINMSLNITVTNLKGTPEIVYDLSWEPNPENDESRLRGYNIYKKENDGEWELLLSVNNSTHTASFTFTGAESRIQFGIKTVSIYDTEGEMAVFGIDE